MKSETYNMDCMVGMRDTPDNYYSLAIVDPPYGISEPAFRRDNVTTKAASLTNYQTTVYEQAAPPLVYFQELQRISTNQIIWGGNYFIDHLSSTRSMIVWDKETKDAQWADAEIAWTSFSNSVRIFKFAWNGMIQGNMKNKENRIHPTQKPVALYKWLLTNYAKPGDTIYDSHMGSQSSRIAAWDLGFDYVGHELDPDYFKAGCERFEIHRSQPKLFEPAQEIVTQDALF